MFKKGLVILTSIILGTTVFALGKRDIDEREVSQIDSWQEEFDISSKKEGKYNVITVVEDKGGNTTIGGPFNIFIDPDSDYTISGITNPIQNMRVPGNLNIVGTCIDDDGVQEVWLIFDGGEPVKANGKEFWSYYLDTTQLAEGSHTIEVYGVDINGLSSISKPKKKAYVTWNLDRRLPETKVTNLELGTLVSGKIELKGEVSDGNGIKSLYYSLDGRKTFSQLKLKEDKKTGICTFELPLDTRKTQDGATVCWFKSTDKMGSVGYNSFLYFIDNTKPDVKIVSPAENEVANGRFGVTGFAKDKIGIKKLTWACAGQTGEFELTPGNPYWYKEIDSTGFTKNIEFSVTALDTAGNEVTVKKVIPLNQDADKPTVSIEYPAEGGTVEGEAGNVFLRGIAFDDDAVASVEYSLDGGETSVLETNGVFYALLSGDKELSAGKHTVTVTATDLYGVKGKPATATFISRGNSPQFSEPKILSSQGEFSVFADVEIHPEANPKYETTVSCEAGISSVGYQINWGSNGSKTGEVNFKAGEKSVPLSIALSGDDIAWGTVTLTISATDIYNRTSIQKSAIKIKDLTDITVEKPELVFSDSRISENGYILNDLECPVSGYFVGGKIKSATLNPSTPFATISYDEHSVTLHAVESAGSSAPVKVRVVADNGIVYESRPLVFHSDFPSPEISVENEEENLEFTMKPDGTYLQPLLKVHVRGKVSSLTPLTSLTYRIGSIAAECDSKNPETFVTSDIVWSEVENLPAKNGDFSFELEPSTLVNGISLVEIVANNGKQAAASVMIRKIEPRDIDPKKAVAVHKWVDSVDVYCAIICHTQTQDFKRVFLRSQMPGGNPVLTVKDSSGKETKYTTKKDGNAKVFISSVAGRDYASGMQVAVPRGVVKDSPVTATATIVSDYPITSLNWTIDGEDVPGGDKTQAGKIDAKSLRQKDSTHYEADIPLSNLPSRLTSIKLVAESSQGSASFSGTVAIVRERDSSLLDNEKKIYWIPSENAPYDEANSRYVLKTATKFTAFANVYSPVTVSFAQAQTGLSFSVEGKYIYITAEKEGLYKNVVLKITDALGIVYNSTPITLLVDDFAPTAELVAPETKKWVQTGTNLSVKATDTNGIASVEYSLDAGESWNSAKQENSTTYSATLNLQEKEDGLIPLGVRVKDNAGKITYTQTVIQKDTTVPEVEVILPVAQDIVNGENLIAFRVKDNGHLNRAEYLAPKANSKEKVNPIEIPLGPMVVTHIGTVEKPINDLMIFNFYDDAGNVATIRKWDFIIDQKSDLPIAEVHLPEEEAVITTDFVISGVVLDDDGPAKIYYKIDNGEYRLSSEEYGTTFSISVPLSSMKDNEHKVTVYAEDLNGVKGPEFVRNFKISLEEPKGAVETPPIDQTVRDWVKLSGIATDKNGISKVLISVDGGNTYNEAKGNFAHETEKSNWTYEFDTRVVEDGTHVVFLKVVDWFGIEGLYSSLINIDNTAPKIDLELPLDDSKTTKMLFFSGQTTDNIGLDKLYITIRSLEGKTVSSKLARLDLVPGEIISQSIDMSSLPDGFYNIELTGLDVANNITRVSRNVQLDKTAAVAKVDLLYPLNGEFVQGVFNIYGTAVSEINIENLELLIDGQKAAETQLSSSGYYKFNLTPELIAEGQHKIQVKANFSNASSIMSNEQYINYNSVGPWVTIDNFTYGDFAMDRPYIVGNAGYSIAEDELIAAKTKGASNEIKSAVAAKSVEKVEISLNNGKSFKEVSTSGKWRYRVENEDIAEGYHFLLVRATMRNGEKAVSRTIVQVDKTSPNVRLISPGEGGRFNQTLEVSGLAHDNVALKSVTLALRKGDKATYEVPTFIQGLYLDWHFWGATLFDIGVGLSFFNDNVRLQAQWGQFTQTQRNMFSKTDFRYGGDSIFGGKILANVVYLPFMYFLGRDYEWLSANITVGANFTRFNESASGKPQILSAVLAQLEFPRITFAKQKMFRTIAFYTEGQLWFVPTDVNSQVDVENLIPQISVGLRVNVF
ncbi:Ig-like domain-containing protein [Treponema pectinovorum]|uniref:Ig-like domain-containing protein n=1 Tax=Treponema pectinovorum TaxID=164 RepID=UPI003D8F0489